MSYKAGSVVIDIKADTAKLVSGMEKAEKSVKTSINNIQKTILTLATAYAGIQGVRAFKNMIDDSLDAADATGKLAQKIGIATEKLSEYQYAAGFAAVSNGELNAGLSALTRRLNNFQISGGGAGKKGFEALGISAEYAKKNFTSLDIAFEDILKRLEKMPDGYKKTAAAQDIFSKSASSVLRLTATDLEKFSKEAKRIGISISQSTYDMAASYHDQMDQLDARMKGIKQTVAFSVIAPMNAASQTALDFIDNAFGGTAQDKMTSLENIAVTSISNIIYSFGTLKDSVSGIELVLKTAELGFVYLVKGIAEAFNVSNRLANSAIEKYNSLPDWMRGGKIELNQLRDVSVVDNQIDSIKAKIGELTNELTNGGITADEYAKKFIENLAKIKSKALKKKVASPAYDNVDTTSLNKYAYDLWVEQEKNKADILQKASDKSKSDYETKTQLENDWQTLMQDNQDSILDSQIALAESGMDWGNSLEGVAGNIANLGKAMSQVHVAELKATKAQGQLDAKYSKQFTEYAGDELKTKELLKNYNADSAKLKTQQQEAELAGYSNLAGSMASMYEQGTSGAIAFTAVQSALGIASAWTAIASAWAETGTLAMKVASAATVTAAVMPIIGQLGGSGGGGATPPPTREEEYQQKADDYEASYEPITDRLDRQIELLQSIDGYGGTAVSRELLLASEEYTKQSTVDATDALGSIGKEFWGSVESQYFKIENGYHIGSYSYPAYDDSGSFIDGNGTYDRSASFEKYDEELDRIKELYGEAVNISHFERYKKDMTYAGFDGRGDWSVSLNDDYLSNQNNQIEFLMKLNENDDLEKFGIDDQEYKDIINQAEQTAHDFSMSIIDSFQTVLDAGQDFRDSYDALYDDFYTKQDLSNATSDVNNLLADANVNMIGSDLTMDEYLQSVISSIDGLNLTTEQTALLNSDEEEDLVAKIALNDELSKKMTDSEIAALNYKDSIDLVTEAMANSEDNIKSWEDSFKSEDEITKDMADSLGVGVATTNAELQSLFDTFTDGKDSTKFLTDAELEFLDANKAMIESISDLAIAEVDYQEYIMESTQQIADTINTAMYDAMKATNDYADSLKDITDLSSNLSEDLTTQGMDSRDKQFYYLTQANLAANSTNDLLSSGADSKLISTEYSKLLDYSKRMYDLNPDASTALNDRIDSMNVEIDTTAEALKVQVIDTAESVDFLTQEQLDALGLAKDENGDITQIAENTAPDGTTTIAGYLKDLTEQNILMNEIALAPLAADTSFEIGHTLGDQESLDMATILGTSDYEDFYTLLKDFSVKNDSEDITLLNDMLTNDTYKDYFSKLSTAGMLPDDIIEANTIIKEEEEENDRKISEYAHSYVTDQNYIRMYEEIITNPMLRPGAKVIYENKISELEEESILILKNIDTLKENVYTSFAVGTPRVPYDMTANIHKDEMIIPATFSDALRDGDLFMGSLNSTSSNYKVQNKELVDAIKGLTDITAKQAEEIRTMRKEMQDQSDYLSSIEEKVA